MLVVLDVWLQPLTWKAPYQGSSDLGEVEVTKLSILLKFPDFTVGSEDVIQMVALSHTNSNTNILCSWQNRSHLFCVNGRDLRVNYSKERGIVNGSSGKFGKYSARNRHVLVYSTTGASRSGFCSGSLTPCILHVHATAGV